MGPNPLNLPLTGIIGKDIILDKFGNQVAYRCGAIWPGPTVWSRFNDLSHPDGYLKEVDSETGVSYWVKPYTGVVTNGKWVSWKEEKKKDVSGKKEKQQQEGGREGRSAEQEAKERLTQQVELGLIGNLMGSLKTLPRPDPSAYDPTS